MGELQSQTKIVQTLPPNAVFFASGLSPRPLNVGYRSKLTKSSTPTLRVQENSKVSQQLQLRL